MWEDPYGTGKRRTRTPALYSLVNGYQLPPLCGGERRQGIVAGKRVLRLSTIAVMPSDDPKYEGRGRAFPIGYCESVPLGHPAQWEVSERTP